jgi:hypothetical protein
MKTLPVEAVVRGYLEGSGWKEYSEGGKVCGVPLPAGLKRASKLPEPIFTPATKAEAGHHDENITFERMAQMVGDARAKEVRDTAIRLYKAAADYALARGIIIADTKFEFGIDEARQLCTSSTRRSRPIPRASGRSPVGKRAIARRASTSSTCATGSTRSASRGSPPRPRCRPTLPRALPRSTRKPPAA